MKTRTRDYFYAIAVGCFYGCLGLYFAICVAVFYARNPGMSGSDWVWHLPSVLTWQRVD